MRTNRFVASLIMGFLVSAALAQAQAPLSSDSLRNRLERAYPLTEMDAGGIKVVKPGTIFVVQQNGIQANAMKFKPFANKYEDGKISAKGLANVIPGDITQAKTLAVHDRVYLTSMLIGEDSITMTVQSCGGCDPAAVDPGHKPHWASIQFKFIKGYLTSTDLTHIRDAIGSLLAPAVAPAAQAPTTFESPQPAAQAQTQTDGPPTLRHFDDLTPPPAPPTTPPAPQRPTLMREGETPQSTRESNAAQGPAQASSTPGPRPKNAEPVPEVKSLTGPAPAVKDNPKSTEPPIPDIETGWSRDKVNSVLGTPLKDQKSGGQEILTYPRITVTLEKGRVVATAANL